MEFNELAVVVLAGSDENPDILGGGGQPSKFFMPFGDGLVGHRVLRAIDGLKCCKSICIAAPPERIDEHPFSTDHPLYLVPQGASSTESMANGVRGARKHGDCADGAYVLIVSGDLPLLSTAALGHFMEVCSVAEEADLYLGMLPNSAVPEELRAVYDNDFIPFRGGLYMHTETYLLRPDTMGEVGRRRFEEVMTIRRLDRRTLRGAWKIARTLVSTVGLRSMLPLARILMEGSGDSGDVQGEEAAGLDRVERAALRIVRDRLGPRANLVTVDEPGLALEFDHLQQLKVLEGYACRNETGH
jgi:hypothetical protein